MKDFKASSLVFFWLSYLFGLLTTAEIVVPLLKYCCLGNIFYSVHSIFYIDCCYQQWPLEGAVCLNLRER